MPLKAYFQKNNKVALGFSGGVDSSYLLWAAKEAGCDIRPYFVDSPFQPRFEKEDAEKVAQLCGVPLTVITADIFTYPQVTANPANRCYLCKQVIFGALWEAAKQDGYPILVDGTNASDNPGDRPGMQALAELSVQSPLRDCGLTKEAIREKSREAGLFTWNKPSYACLATRITTGQTITPLALEQVEHAENTLFAMGFTDFRVRLDGATAKIQVPANQMEKVLSLKESIIDQFPNQWAHILLDLHPRD